MNLKKVLLTTFSCVLLGVTALSLSSHSVSAVTTEDTSTAILNVQKAKESTLDSNTLAESKVFAKTLWDIGGGPGGMPGGPRIWQDGWRYWRN